MWDHLPTPTELLEARRERGWTPTPTSTVDGEHVLCDPRFDPDED